MQAQAVFCLGFEQLDIISWGEEKRDYIKKDGVRTMLLFWGGKDRIVQATKNKLFEEWRNNKHLTSRNFSFKEEKNRLLRGNKEKRHIHKNDTHCRGVFVLYNLCHLRQRLLCHITSKYKSDVVLLMQLKSHVWHRGAWARSSPKRAQHSSCCFTQTSVTCIWALTSFQNCLGLFSLSS